jgi:hypothetical protein
VLLVKLMLGWAVRSKLGVWLVLKLKTVFDDGVWLIFAGCWFCWTLVLLWGFDWSFDWSKNVEAVDVAPNVNLFASFIVPSVDLLKSFCWGAVVDDWKPVTVLFEDETPNDDVDCCGVDVEPPIINGDLFIYLFIYL